MESTGDERRIPVMSEEYRRWVKSPGVEKRVVKSPGDESSEESRR